MNNITKRVGLILSCCLIFIDLVLAGGDIVAKQKPVVTEIKIEPIFKSSFDTGSQSDIVSREKDIVVELKAEPNLSNRLDMGIKNKQNRKRGFYSGIGIGWMQLKDESTKEYFDTIPIMVDVGYTFNDYIALESRYSRDMGKVRYENGNTSSPENGDFPTMFSNIGLYVKPMYPLGDFNLYGIFGYGLTTLTDIHLADRSESSFQYGVGLSYGLTRDFSVFADYSNLYHNKGFDGRAQNRNVNVEAAIFGFNYAF